MAKKEGFFKNLSQMDLAGLTGNLAEGLANEWLGVDDFTRFVKYASKGDFLKAAKSLGAGFLELGGTAAMVIPGGQGIGVAAKAGKLGKLGKVSKIGRGMRGLSLEEQVLQRAALKSGAKRSATRAASGAEPELLAKNLKEAQLNEAGRFSKKFDVENKLSGTGEAVEKAAKTGKRTSKELLDEAKTKAGEMSERVSQFNVGRIPVGGSRGGVLGSVGRGAGQITGALPASQGPLARRAYAQRLAGVPVTRGAKASEFLSGKLGAAAMRTGVDTEIMAPFMRTPEPISTTITAADVAKLSEEELMALLSYLQQGTSPGAA